MPYQISWDDTATGVVTLKGEVTRTEFEALSQEIKIGLKTVAKNKTHKAALIFDIQYAQMIPPTDNTTRELHSYANDPHLKWILIGGKNKLVRLILMLCFNLASANVRLFESVEAAKTFRNQLHLTMTATTASTTAPNEV
jgi:hypothetical protein